MNDILRPELIWIEGRCYRVNDPTAEISTLQEHDLYENDMPYNDIDDEDDIDDDYEISQVDNNRYCTRLHVSKHYMGFVIGKKGATVGRIRRDTRTDIKIPKQGENNDITIYGSSISNVKAARRRINIIVMSSRMKQPSTHFVSIPVNDTNIRNNFENFKESVLQECSNSGLDDSLFIRSEKLHLTVGMLCLMDNEERMQASELLMEAKEKYIIPILQDYLPLNVRLKGISYMNDDPKQTHVLYARVEEANAPAGLLQRMVDAIVQHFYRAGLMEKEFGRDSVKMHVTLMNSKYKAEKKDLEEDSPRRRPRESFDASQILERFSDYDFGVTQLNDIHLSQRHCMGPDGYYQSTCIISCNKQ
ncbi:unnamed protein product, partial [Brenthis ino]